ncbi:Na+/H+ antiporter NhaC family protein [Sphingobacterium wenxiniae]|uniref:Na+/H+ antiporter NhaC n=1 Tax=Sphingobacterium wenxiniae TaxID=683125 RepID=A0A1I6NSM3_9SPHI|nr:Na+/H+ antiporter NhaC family protein [Sphingobacterium wenxiniae]SFS30947.1 Na+/H+ antiporter NhaC [Sphingobacterium wenxiniae]
MGGKVGMQKGNFWALLPLIVFVVIYFSGSLYLNDFYAIPTLVVFVFCLFIALFQSAKKPLAEKLKHFAKGSGDENILVMILIFLLAGAFGELSKAIGGISSTINFALSYVSPQFIIASLFLVACFISTSLGTSVGTIVALAPIAVGLEDNLPGSMALSLAAVIGGAMFGDNLSFISDTTIAATRTQGVGMRDKFRVNFRIVFPVAVICFCLYVGLGFWSFGEGTNIVVGESSFVKIIPYILVFVIALLGVNVIWTLGIGVLSASLVGLGTGSINFLEALQAINIGFAGMFELSLLCLIIGGIVGIIRYNGGIEFLLHQVSKRIKNARGAELGIAFLTMLVDICIANNTIAIVIVGPLAKDISDKNQLEPKRVASILDTMSCFAQGIIPYGAQMLAALAAAKIYFEQQDNLQAMISPLDIIQYLYYPFLIGLATILFILFRKRKALS